MILGKFKRGFLGKFLDLGICFWENDLGELEKSQQIQEVLCEK